MTFIIKLNELTGVAAKVIKKNNLDDVDAPDNPEVGWFVVRSLAH